MTCPSCCADLTGAVETGSGLLCPGCNHLWVVVDGQPRATNARRIGDPMTAQHAAALLPHEVAR